MAGDWGSHDALGPHVRAARERRGWSREQLAELTGVSARTLGDVETGRRRPRASTVRAVLDALDLDPSDLALEASAPVSADVDTLARLLTDRRHGLGLTQREVANRALVSERTIADLENARSRPRPSTLTAVLLALEIEDDDRPPFDRAAGLTPTPEPGSVHRAQLHGRATDMTRLDSGLATHRLVTITGPGGVGKTRLVEEYMRQRTGGGRSVMVRLDDVNDADAVAPAVLVALGADERAGEELDSVIIEALAGVDLLVVDNAEQVADAGPRIAGWVAASEAACLVTSRVALRVASELVIDIAPLDLDGADSAAAQMFVEVARRERQGWDPDDVELAVVDRICAALDGLPLALELAAAWMRLMDVGEILSRLDRPLGLLKSSDSDRPDRHMALANAIESSYVLVSAEAQRAFEDLSVLAPRFDMATAEAVLGREVLDVIAELVDASLVRTDFSSGRSGLVWLQTVRSFARERLRQRGDEAAAWLRYTGHVAGLAERAGPELVGPDQAVWIEQLDRSSEHVAAVMDRAVMSGDPATVVRIGAHVWRYLYMRGRYSTAVGWLGRVAPGSVDVDWSSATCKYGIGIIRYLRGENDAAESDLRSALSDFELLDDAHGRSSSLSALGMIAEYRGRLDDARDLFSSASQVATAGGASRAGAVAAANLGSLDERAGRLDGAESGYRDAMLDFERLGDSRAVADMALNLSGVMRVTGRYEEALDIADRARRTFESLGDESGLADSDRVLGWVMADIGDYEVARDRLEESRRRSETIGDSWGDASCRSTLVCLAVWTGESADLSEAEGALAEQRELEHVDGVAQGLVAVAEVRWAAGDSDGAIGVLDEVDALPTVPIDVQLHVDVARQLLAGSGANIEVDRPLAAIVRHRLTTGQRC